MENILIAGSAGHAKVVIETVELEGKYKIIGLLDKYRPIGEETLGYPILGDVLELASIASKYDCRGILIAIGDNFARNKVLTEARASLPNVQLVNAIHPSANVSKRASIGKGVVIMAGVSVGPSSAVEDLCILNTNSSIDHDSSLKYCASMAPNSATGGHCTIGAFAAVGVGACLIHNVNVGEHSIIGAGATVVADIQPFTVAYGTPARTIRKRVAGEKYL